MAEEAGRLIDDKKQSGQRKGKHRTDYAFYHFNLFLVFHERNVINDVPVISINQIKELSDHSIRLSQTDLAD